MHSPIHSNSHAPSLPQSYYPHQPLHFLSHHTTLQHHLDFKPSNRLANYKPRSLDALPLKKKSLKKSQTKAPQQHLKLLPLSMCEGSSKENMPTSLSKIDRFPSRYTNKQNTHQTSAPKQKTSHHPHQGEILQDKKIQNNRKKYIFPPPIHHEPLPIDPVKIIGQLKHHRDKQTTTNMSSIAQKISEFSESQFEQSNATRLPFNKISPAQNIWGSIQQSIVVQNKGSSKDTLMENKCWNLDYYGFECCNPDLPQQLPETSIFAQFRQSLASSQPDNQLLVESLLRMDTLNSEMLSSQNSKQKSTQQKLPSIDSCTPKDSSKQKSQKKSIRQLQAAQSNLKSSSDRNSLSLSKSDNRSISQALERMKLSAKYTSKIIRVNSQNQAVVSSACLCGCTSQMMQIIKAEGRK